MSKIFADLKTENGYERICIWTIYNGFKKYNNIHPDVEWDEYYTKFYKHKLYSTHSKELRKKAMLLVRNTPFQNSYFRYKSRLNEKGQNESLSHELYKDIINELDVITLVVGNTEIKLYVSESDIEVGFNANGHNYYADVFICFNKSEPTSYYYKWKGKLCFEIKLSHSVDEVKISDCFIDGIPIFEHKISPYLLIDDKLYSEQSIMQQKEFVKGRLSEKIFGKLLSNPSSKEYLYCSQVFKDNDMLINENKKLKETNESLDAENQFLQMNMEMMEQELQNLSNENVELTSFKSKIYSNRFLRLIIKLFRIE